MSAERFAEAIWEGNLAKGQGKFNTGSGAIGEQAVTWASRTERSEGKTSPEELLAAAQASCYAMAFSNELSKANATPEKVTVKATCTFELNPARVSTMKIEVKGVVKGIEEAAFVKIAEETAKGCPISKALLNNVEISVHASLEK